MSDSPAPRSADDIARAMMSAYHKDEPRCFEILPSDHAGIVKLYRQEQQRLSVLAFFNANPQIKSRYEAYVAASKNQRGGA
jgi:hypothetical protein